MRKELKIKTRDEAKRAGEKYYFTGEPCPKGHIARRFVHNYNCISCKNKKDFFRKDKERDIDKAWSLHHGRE